MYEGGMFRVFPVDEFMAGLDRLYASGQMEAAEGYLKERLKKAAEHMLGEQTAGKR